MEQAIITTTVHPTPGEVAVRCTAKWGTAVHEWNDGLTEAQAHLEAATQFAIDRGWIERLVTQRYRDLRGGTMPDGNSLCFVVVPRR